MQRIFEERVAWTIAAVLVAASFAAGWAVSLAAALPEEGEFNVMSWELRHLPDKWLYLAGSFFTGGLSEQEQDEVSLAVGFAQWFRCVLPMFEIQLWCQPLWSFQFLLAAQWLRLPTLLQQRSHCQH